MTSKTLTCALRAIGAASFIVFFAASIAAGKDWHELGQLDEVRLDRKITEFQENLKKNASDPEMLKALGIAFHVKAQKDQKQFASAAMKYLGQAYEIDKKDYETMCYFGSAKTMMAKTTWNPIKKMSYANDGLALMDKAVKRAPDNVSVRMVRGSTQVRLPAFFKRKKTALEDFEHLDSLIQKNPGERKLLRKRVYANLALLYDEKGEKEKAEKFKTLADSQ